MKRIRFILLFIGIINNAFSQEFKYGGNIGNWVNDWAIDMEKTSDGSLIMSTDNQARYWSIGITYSPETFYGLYKIDNTGKLEWSFDFFRTNWDYHEYSIAQTTLDENDNIYALIYVYQLDQPDSIDGHTYYPGLNLFKINQQGKVVWIKKIGTTDDRGSSILYKNGHLYVLGLYTGDLELSADKKFTSKSYYQCFEWIYEQGTDYFIAKYDTDGNLLNAVSFGEDYPDIAIDATIDNDENIYFLGVSDYFAGCINAYSHITKVDKDLNILWKKVTSLEVGNEGLFYSTNIHLAKNNNLYVWGSIYKKVTTADYTLEPGDDFSGGEFSPFLLEFNSTDGHFLRKMSLNTRTVNFTQGSSDDIRRYFVNGYMDDFGEDLVVHTAYSGDLTIGDTTISSSYHDGYHHNLLLLKVNLKDFTPTFISEFYGSKFQSYSEDFPGKIITDEKNNIYLSGTFSDTPIYIMGNEINNNSGNGCYDVFYSKIDMNSLLSGTNEIQQNKNDIEIYPNPCSTYLKYRCNESIDEIRIYSMMGTFIGVKLSNNNIIDTGDLKSGSYSILFCKNKKIVFRKIIIKE
jgi:hypothetical protein